MSPLCEGCGPERKWNTGIKPSEPLTSNHIQYHIFFTINPTHKHSDCVLYTSLHLLHKTFVGSLSDEIYLGVVIQRERPNFHQYISFFQTVNRSISVWTVDGDHCNKKAAWSGCRWHCDSFTFVLNSPQRAWLVGQIIVMHPVIGTDG